MSTVAVDALLFDFAVTGEAQKYDDWQHVNRAWIARQDKKKLDVVAVERDFAGDRVWLIEAKDFRTVDPAFPPRRENVADLHLTVEAKVRDTLDGLADTAAHAAIPIEKRHANLAVQAVTRRVVLHLEPHAGPHSALFPAKFAASVLQKLRVAVQDIDPRPMVLDIASTPRARVPWTVR